MSQIQEDGKKRNNGNKNPGDDHGSYCNDSDDLEKHLKERERCEANILQTATTLKGLLLLCGLPLVKWGWFLNSVQEEIFPLYLCYTISKVTAGYGTELMWLTVWKKNDHCTNSHLVAGENLPLGHSSSYPWLSRAFPSTLLACKPPWQSNQPTSMATVTGRELWEPHCGCLIHHTLATQPSTTLWLITLLNVSVTHLNQDTRAA